MGPVLPVITAVAAVGSVIQAKKAADAQKKSQELQAKRQAIQTSRSRRSAIREVQIRRAEALASAVGAGSFRSSGFLGGVGSLTSQLGTNLGTSSVLSSLSRNISQAEQEALDAQFKAKTFGNIANFGIKFGGADPFLKVIT